MNIYIVYVCGINRILPQRNASMLSFISVQESKVVGTMRKTFPLALVSAQPPLRCFNKCFLISLKLLMYNCTHKLFCLEK